MVDTEDREPSDQEREDFDAAMDMSAAELIAVTTAYMRRLRAEDACGEAHERGDKDAEQAAWEVMFDADDEARGALGMDDEGCACAAPLKVLARPSAKAGTASQVALCLASPVAGPHDADTAVRN